MKENNMTLLTFKGIFHTKYGEIMKISGSIEELGEWDVNKSKSLYTNEEIYPEWNMECEIYLEKGTKFEFKFLYYNTKTGEYKWEILPNNMNRIYSVEYSGYFIILSEEGKIGTNNSIKRKLKRSYSEYQFSQLKNSNDIEVKGDYLNSDINKFDYESNPLNIEFREDNNFYIDPKMNPNDNIILITKYLPIEITYNNNIVSFKINEENGLYFTLYKIKQLNICNVKWFGLLRNWENYSEDDLFDIQTYLEEKDFYMVIPNSKGDYQKDFIYINKILKPLFIEFTWNSHNDLFLDYDDYFSAYKEINKNFSSRVANIVNPNDLIMINDIDLMLLPSYLLTKNNNLKIGFFFHQPFPSSDVIKNFPYNQEILKSVLLCDVIGFHVFFYARNFLTVCKRILGLFYEVKHKGFITLNYIGREIIIKIVHAGVDINLIKSIIGIENRKVSYQTENIKKDKFEINKYKKISNNNIFSVLDYEISQSLKREYCEWKERYKEYLEGKFSLVSVDEFEKYSSFLLKFEGYKRFLNRLQEAGHNLSNITFLQLIKIRDKNNIDLKYRNEVEKIISEIKSIYGKEVINILWYDEISTQQRLALFSLGSILYYLIVRQGTSSYICEFISVKYLYNKNKLLDEEINKNMCLHKRYSNNNISLIDFQFGIIMSENSALPKTFVSPIRINPFSVNSITDSILFCFKMSYFLKLENLRRDIEIIKSNLIYFWIKSFFIDLKRTININSQNIGIGMGLQFRIMKLKNTFIQLNKKELCDSFCASKLKLFFFDYEGTLQSSQIKTGEETLLGYAPNKEVIDILTKLCSNSDNLVFIVSGREKKKIEEWFGGINNINLASEHGFFNKINEVLKNKLKENNYNKDDWEEIFNIKDWSWKDSVLKILEGFTEKTEGSFIYKKDSIITWFYRDCDIYFGMLQANEINTHLHNIFEYCNLDIVNGKGYVEIKPQGINKGYFLSYIIKKLIKNNLIPDFIFAVGDDTADEEMFKYLSSIKPQLENYNNNIKIFTTTIGKKPSSANYYLNNSEEVIDYLDSLNKVNNRNEYYYGMSNQKMKKSKSKSNFK